MSSFSLLTEAVQTDSIINEEITRRDFTEWLRQVELSEKEFETKIRNQKDFDEVIFEILDNDPKLELIGGNEAIKRKLANSLWYQYQAKKTSAPAIKSASSASKTAANQRKKQAKAEDEEVETSGVKNIVKKSVGLPLSIESVIGDGYIKGLNVADPAKAKQVKNPYTAGTTRNKLWQQAFKRGHAKCIATNPQGGAVEMGRAEEEELMDQSIDQYSDQQVGEPQTSPDFNLTSDDPLHLAGYTAYIQLASVLDDGEQPEYVNPFEVDSEEYVAYEEGWYEGQAEIDAGSDFNVLDPDGDGIEEFEHRGQHVRITP